MRLAQAIRLGSLLIQNPMAGRADRCAIGMANAANGCVVAMDGDADIDYEREVQNQGHLRQAFPWISNVNHRCSCGTHCLGNGVITHYFDSHVMGDKSMTLEQLCDFIESIDPTPKDEPQVQEELGTDGLRLQGSCATLECPNDRTRSSELCATCYSEAELCAESDRQQGMRI